MSKNSDWKFEIRTKEFRDSKFGKSFNLLRWENIWSDIYRAMFIRINIRYTRKLFRTNCETFGGLTGWRKVLVWRQITGGSKLKCNETCWLPTSKQHENSDIVISIVYRRCTHICREIRELGTAFVVTGRSKFIFVPSRCANLRRIILENDGETYSIIVANILRWPAIFNPVDARATESRIIRHFIYEIRTRYWTRLQAVSPRNENGGCTSVIYRMKNYCLLPTIKFSRKRYSWICRITRFWDDVAMTRENNVSYLLAENLIDFEHIDFEFNARNTTVYCTLRYNTCRW